jgi:hypothetical protein
MTDSGLREMLIAESQLANFPDAPPKQVLGVVVEVGLDSGLDLLAAYADCSARARSPESLN